MTKQARAAAGTYRLPREHRNEHSRILTLHWDGRIATMSGGKHGSYQVETADIKRVRSHWAGYVSNNRGIPVTPNIRIEY